MSLTTPLPIARRRMAPDAAPVDLAAPLARPLDRAAQRAVDRACSDLRRGETVVLAAADGRALLVQAAEMVTGIGLSALASLAGAGHAPCVVLTGQRARALGHDVPEQATVVLRPDGMPGADLVRSLADPTQARPLPTKPVAKAESFAPGTKLEG
ncbi:MAG: cyclohydrolase, partial [Pseudomonadota bacterium]